MLRVSPTISVLAAVLALATAAPAWAGYGAIAYDNQNGHEGAAWNQSTPAKANELALQQCATGNCRVHPIKPAGCGALARSGTDKAWGGADRVTLAAAEHTAILLCEKHASTGACKVVAQGCNK
jgi:hypothetical protein